MLFGKWKRQKEFNKRLSATMKAFDKTLKNSFSNVSDDVNHIKQWINYLHLNHDKISDSISNIGTRISESNNRIVSFDERIGKVDDRLHEIDTKIADLLTKEEIKEYIDEYYNYVDKLHSHVTVLAKDTTQLKNMQSQIADTLSNTVTSFTDQLTNLKNDVSGINKGVELFGNNISKQENNVSDIQNSLSNLKSETSTEISMLKSQQKNFISDFEDMPSKIQKHFKDNLLEEVEYLRNDTGRQVQEAIRVVDQKLDAFADKKTVFEKLDILNIRIDELGRTQKAILQPQQPQQIQQSQQIQQPQQFQQPNQSVVVDKPAVQPRHSNLREKIFRNVTRQSKEYVKGMLVSLIKKYGNISGLNLREIVVEEQGLVSKSSFYRLLQEIEDHDYVHVLQQGKEKHYTWALHNSAVY